jgi:hypothetical protein
MTPMKTIDAVQPMGGLSQPRVSYAPMPSHAGDHWNLSGVDNCVKSYGASSFSIATVEYGFSRATMTVAKFTKNNRGRDPWIVWYRSGKMWSGCAPTRDRAIAGALADAWLYA